MHLDRILTTCPYLIGSPEGAACNGALTLLRNIQDFDPDICMSRHYELCHIYISKLIELNSNTTSADNETAEISSTKILTKPGRESS
jgi:hypothetical protein